MLTTPAVSVKAFSGSLPGAATRSATEVDAWPVTGGAVLKAAGIGWRADPTAIQPARTASGTAGRVESATRTRPLLFGFRGLRARSRKRTTEMISVSVANMSSIPGISGRQGSGAIGSPVIRDANQRPMMAAVPSAAARNSLVLGATTMATASATWARPSRMKKTPHGRYSARWPAAAAKWIPATPNVSSAAE